VILRAHLPLVTPIWKSMAIIGTLATMEFECYAQRLLNPFRGVINTIRHESAEAVTADGVHWDIYVSNESLQRDLAGRGRTQVSDIRYGRWSAAKGLKRGPIFPSDDFREMEAMGTVVFNHLLTVHEQVPFTFTDRFELWLLDAESRPLALIDSATELEGIKLNQPCSWRPGQNCRSTFTSPTARELGLQENKPAVLADHLSTYVNSRTADRASAQVFSRSADGSGKGLCGINIENELEGRELDAQAFPVLLLNTDADDHLHSRLLQDFTCWQAPWLLLLPTLDTGQRREYEQHARVQAMKVADHYHLYPSIIDQQTIDSARIEARLRKTVPEKKPDEFSMSPFYLELDSD
jgi:hypothetical protein